MKRIIGVSLAILLAFTALGALSPQEAEAQAVDCGANDLSVYDALICYFHGNIGRARLEAILPDPDGDPGTPAVTGPTSTATSNTGQATDASNNSDWTDRDFAQQFTTGSLTGTKKWQVTSVALDIVFNVPSPATVAQMRVQIYASDTSGKPTGNALGTLTLPSGQTEVVAGSNTFSTSSPIQLNPGTAYVVVVDVTAQSSAAGEDVQVGHTDSDDEDDGGQPGWSIGATAFSGSWSGPGNYGSGHENDPLKLAITANEYTPAVPPSPPPPAFSQTHAELGDDYTQSTVCGGKPHPVHEAFRRDPLGTDWSYADSVFCNERTGQWVTGRPYEAGRDFSTTENLIAPGGAGYAEKCRYDKPGYRHNDDGTVTVIRGANYDPLADVCTQRGTALDD